MSEVTQAIPSSADIVVVGGGMVGAALALALSPLDVRVLLLEGQALNDEPRSMPALPDVAFFERRVSAISPSSQRILARLGAWGLIPPAYLGTYTRMCVWDAEGTGEIHFDAADMSASSLGHIVENRLITDALYSALRESPVEVRDRVTVTGWQALDGRSVLSLADGSRVEAGLVVAADGARSPLRQWAGLPIREWDYGQRAIVATVQTEKPHNYTAWQRFTQTGPLAFLPLADGQGGEHFLSIVWSQETLEAERLMGLDDTQFCRELGAAFERRLGDIRAVSMRQAFPLRQCHAKAYVRQGLALVGDAAHTIHPLAGQGVNLGFADVAVLAEEVERALRRHLSPGDISVLQRYQRRRRGENLAMMAAMEGFKQLFGRDELLPRWLRNTGMRWLDGQAALKRRIASQAMGLAL